jgi:uncharacterized protein with NAD-binding domain and iron-sulfur cluster
MRNKVVILGGGVAGMSAAQELAERGFAVDVFELGSIPGGKARSLPAAVPANRLDRRGSKVLPRTGRRHVHRPLPAEHGFRFFPGFYQHVIDTMKRIPFGSQSVADNLVDTTRIHLARFGRPPVFYPARFPQNAGELLTAVRFMLGLLAGELDVPPTETAFFIDRVFQIISSCEERRREEYERIAWWDFVGADDKSIGYQKFFANGFTRSLVAAKAERASTKTIGDIFVQMVLSALTPLKTADRVLNGPTNSAWIDPWFEHLQSCGVAYHVNAAVQAINCRRSVIQSVTVVQNGRSVEVGGDYFIAALPVERFAELTTRAMELADPALARIAELSKYVEWMNGIQFYLREDRPLVRGHTIFMDTPWALTSVSQAQFWPDYPLTDFADGQVRGILSVCISDWDVQGLNGKRAEQCTREEIKEEVWTELKRSLIVGGEEVLVDDMLHSWFLDPSIESVSSTQPGVLTNNAPLLVNYVNTWRLRPEAVTAIRNLFLASDYVRTYTDIATMEGANEAARRAVNGVLDASRSQAERCTLWKLHEPELFGPMRAYDRERFRQGLPWDGTISSIAQEALTLVGPMETPVTRIPEVRDAAGSGQRDVLDLGAASGVPLGNEGPDRSLSAESPIVRTAVRILGGEDTS